MERAKHVRTAAKAIIIENGLLLAIINRHQDEIYYTLPGGGQQPGEPLAETMRRECLEEIGVQVDVHDLLFLREYISENHEFADTDPIQHQIDCCFEVTMLPGEIPGGGSEPDERQIGIEWLPLQALGSSPFYPKIFRKLIPEAVASRKSVYLGDVN